MIGVDQAMIGRIWLVECGELVRMLLPVEIAAIHNRPAERGAMAAQKLGKRMDDDIGAMFDRPQQDGCGDGVVDDQWHAMTVGDPGQALDVTDVACRVADAFTEHCSRVLVDHFLDRLGTIALGKSDTDSLAWQKMSEEGVGGAVELRRGDHIASQLSYILHRVSHCCLAAGNAKSIPATLERGDAPLQNRGGGVADAGVAKAFGLKVEQGCGVVGAIEFKGDCLVNRHRDGLGCRIGVVTAVDSNRFPFHLFTCPWPVAANCSSSANEAVAAGVTRRFISLTTHWISCSVVLKLVMHARTTGVSPTRASDIHAIWRWCRAARNSVGTRPSRVKQTSGSGVELTMRQPEALSASRSTWPMRVWCSIIS